MRDSIEAKLRLVGRIQVIATEIRLHHPFIIGIVCTPIFKLKMLRGHVLSAGFFRITRMARLPVAHRQAELRTDFIRCRNPVIRPPVHKISLRFLKQLDRRDVIDRIRLEAVAGLCRKGQPVAQVAIASAITGGQTGHALLAILRGHECARRLARVLGNDVDDGQKRIGAVCRGIGAAHHLDALDVVDRQRKLAPVDRAIGGTVNGTAIHQHLETP